MPAATCAEHGWTGWTDLFAACRTLKSMLPEVPIPEPEQQTNGNKSEAEQKNWTEGEQKTKVQRNAYGSN